MALSTQTDAIGQLTQTKTVSGTFLVTSSTSQSSTTNITCNVCCKKPNQHLLGWFGGYPNIQGLCPEALPEWAPLDFYNNGIPVYGTFNLESESEFSLENLCLPETATVYFKNPMGNGQQLFPDGFDRNYPSYSCGESYTPNPTSGFLFEIKTWTNLNYWPYNDDGSSIFNLATDGKARMQFTACVCDDNRGWVLNDRLYFETGDWTTDSNGVSYVVNKLRSPDTYSCSPFSMTYSGYFWARNLFTYETIKVGKFTVTFTF